MDTVYECIKDQESVKMADFQWFFAKSKVPICLAITDSFHILNILKSECILTAEEALELQGDTRTDHRVVYECLCLMEEKGIITQHFFAFLFQKSLLKKYPALKPIHAEFKKGKYRHGIQSTTDKDIDPHIFAQEKVRICLTIKDRFPFLHGLQDLTILSESEALKLQADERPVSRVIYESLSLIEKKDMKLNIVFEYIFQKCYLKLYPGLQDILREPSGDFATFNGGQYPMFRIATDLLEVFKHNKTYICKAVNERFPFLHGLRDLCLLSHMQLLELQADRRSTEEVLYEALCQIQNISDIETFFAYTFQEFYLKMYPDLRVVLQCVNTAMTLDICPPASAFCTEKIAEAQVSKTPITEMVKDEIMDVPEQNSSTPSTVLYEDETRDVQEQDFNEPSKMAVKEEIIEIPEQDSNEPSPVSYVDETRDVHEQDSNKPSTVIPKDEITEEPEQDSSEPSPVLHEEETRDTQEQDSGEPSPVLHEEETRETQEQDSGEPPPVLDEEETRDTQEQDSGEPPPVLHEEKTRDSQEQDSGEPPPVLHEEEIRDTQEQDSGEPSPGSPDVFSRPVRKCTMRPTRYSDPLNPDCEVKNGRKKCKGSGDTVHLPVRRCRMQLINYSELPDLEWEVKNGEKKHKAPEIAMHHRSKKIKPLETYSYRYNVRKWRKEEKRFQQEHQVTNPVTVRLEFPKQVFNKKFRVRCGDKTGIFKKKYWTGKSNKDLCISSEGKKFTVTKFEKFGGRGASKNWKKSIQCEEIKLECLIKAGILKQPAWTKKPNHI